MWGGSEGLNGIEEVPSTLCYAQSSPTGDTRAETVAKTAKARKARK